MKNNADIPTPIRRLAAGLAALMVVLVFAGGAAGCSSSDAATAETRTAESIYEEAMAAYNDEDWLEAQKLFDVIKLQYPASQHADDAQYYLAEINYKKGEYILAAYNYNLLRRAFPTSEYAREALYRASMSYYELSPGSQRDQSYTKQAIQSFAEFQTLYPNDSLAVEAARRIADLREKLAERDYEIAEQYRTLDYPRSALIYFEQVINDFPDTRYAESAYLGKIKVLVRLNRIEEAREVARLYRQQFPSGRHIDEVRQIAANL